MSAFDQETSSYGDILIGQVVDWQAHLKTLRSWKAARVIRYIGITQYATGAIDQLLSIMESEEIDFLQMAYSIGGCAAEDRLLPLAAERGVAVIVNRLFEGGGLFESLIGEDLPG
ncbi:MAG: hypothetical protein VX430_05345 [Pseudomonadota bacterium]|nr:hypothetical protein [Pseudomonadota bacterium]